jgi:lipid A 4'-phosphatase
MGFGFLAVALLLPVSRRNMGAMVAIALGAAIGVMRILQAGHFLSDVVFSGIVVAATVLALHWAMFHADGTPRGGLGRRLSA